MTKIFISYRRTDSANATGRIDDRLVEAFGRENVFKDVDSIPLGMDFREYLTEAVGGCDVLLVVIGDRWLEEEDESGSRRIDNDADYVRIEVESALQRSIPVVPLILDRAQMPKPGDLPPSISDLAYRNATKVRPDPDFSPDIARIIDAIKKLKPAQQAAVPVEDPAVAQPEEDARRKAEEARLVADVEAQQQAAEKEEANLKAEAEEEARQKAEAEAEAKRQAAEKEEARRKAEAEEEARQKAEAEAEAKRQAAEKEEARRKAEAEEEARQKAEAEKEAKRQKAEEEAKRKAEAKEESKRKAAEEKARRKAEAEEEARRKAEAKEEAKRQAAEEEEAQRKAEEEARLAAEAEEEAKRKTAEEEEARRRAEAEEEAQRKAEEEARLVAESESESESEAESESEEEASIAMTCQCGETLSAPAELAGESAECPSCGTVLLIPDAAPPSPAAAAAPAPAQPEKGPAVQRPEPTRRAAPAATKKKMAVLAATGLVVVLGAVAWFKYGPDKEPGATAIPDAPATNETIATATPATVAKKKNKRGATATPAAVTKDKTATTPLPAGVTRDNPFENSLGMRFVPVPITGGQTVLFSVYETRVQDYAAYAAANSGVDREFEDTEFPQDGDHPVVNVSWDDANAFCAWLSDKEGRTYRLPTDHEWSCAVGIGDRESPTASPEDKDWGIADVYPWGSTWPPPDGTVNYDSDGTVAVGNYDPNELGLYNLGGNVYEWCADWYSNDLTSRVLRGGSWYDLDSDLMLSSYRNLDFAPDGRLNYYGFRVVLSE